MKRGRRFFRGGGKERPSYFIQSMPAVPTLKEGKSHIAGTKAGYASSATLIQGLVILREGKGRAAASRILAPLDIYLPVLILVAMPYMGYGKIQTPLHGYPHPPPLLSQGLSFKRPSLPSPRPGRSVYDDNEGPGSCRRRHAYALLAWSGQVGSEYLFFPSRKGE